MHIAYTMAPGRGDTDLILARVADTLLSRGYRVRGTVQINTDRADAGPCDMDVRILPAGPVIRISQSLGRASRGCRLDPSALEAAVGHVTASFAPGVDCLILNKFGKHEAAGRGFRNLIAEAVMQDIPVLVGTNGLNAKAFTDFSGGLAAELPPVAEGLVSWLEARLKQKERQTAAA